MFVNSVFKRLSKANLDFLLQLRLEPLVIIGVFGLGIFLARRASNMWPPTNIFSDPLLLLLPAAGIAWLLLARPALGVLGIVVASMVIPFSLGTGTQTELSAGMLLLMLMLGLYVFTMVVEKKEELLFRSQTFLPLIVFVVVAVLSFLVGQLPWFPLARKASLPAQLGGLALFVLSAGAYFLVGNRLRQERWLAWMVWFFLALGSIHLIGRLIPPLRVITSRIIQPQVYANSTFWIWMIVLALSQALFNNKLRRSWRAALGALTLLILYLSLIRDAGWTSGWLPPLVSVIVMLVISRSPLAWMALLLGAGMALTKLDSIQRLLLAGDNEYSLMTRLEAWRILAEMVRVNPVFGLGPSNYYWYTPQYSILGYYVTFNSHNNYVDLIAQVGLLGLAAFIWFAVTVWLMGWRLRHVVPDGFPRAYVYGVLGGLAGMLAAMMLGDWVIPFVYNVGYEGFKASMLGWMFLGGLVVIERLYGQAEVDQSIEEAHELRGTISGAEQ